MSGKRGMEERRRETARAGVCEWGVSGERGMEERRREQEARAGAQRLVAAVVWRGGERGGEGMIHVAAAVW